MTNTISDKTVPIDAAIKKAITLLQQQDFVSKSPGELIDDKINYCGAAAVAAAGFLLRGEKEMNQASALIKRGGTSEEMIDIFEQFGWDKNIGRTILKLNDSLPIEERKSRVIKFLSSIQAKEFHA